MKSRTDAPHGAVDPLLQEAKSALPEGEELPISFLQRKFRIGYQRAVQLYGAIKETGSASVS